MLSSDFTLNDFDNCFSLRKNTIKLKVPDAGESLAQIIADFLRKKLLEKKEKFSFETVFSHKSKVDIIQEAVNAGYKVYLYFVSTESPEINKFRVQARKNNGGHDVPTDKIESRYYRSLNLVYEASKLAYQTFFFDNSFDGEDFKMFANFKNNIEVKRKNSPPTNLPNWYKFYVLKKRQLGKK